MSCKELLAKGKDCNSLPFCRKLLKMHEAKYEPMDKVRGQTEINIFSISFFLKSLFFSQVDAEKIMEEILGMKAGLNPDQQVKVQTCWSKNNR